MGRSGRSGVREVVYECGEGQVGNVAVYGDDFELFPSAFQLSSTDDSIRPLYTIKCSCTSARYMVKDYTP